MSTNQLVIHRRGQTAMWSPIAARTQHGVFTRAQARSEGLSTNQINHRLRTGCWVRVAGAGLTLAERPVKLLQRAWAGVLTWPDACLWGPTALAIWDLFGFQTAPLSTRPVIDLAVPYGRRHQQGLVAHRLPLTFNTQRADGLPLQDPSQATIESLAYLPDTEADSLFAWLMARNRLDPDEFDQAVTAHKGRPGVKKLTWYQMMVRSAAASPPELRLHQLLNHNGLTEWVANQPIHLDGLPLISVDVLFRRIKLILEVDGWASHSNSNAFQADRTRDSELHAAGYTVLRFTWQDLTARPCEVADRIKRTYHQLQPKRG